LLAVVKARPFVPQRMKWVGEPTTFEIAIVAIGVNRCISNEVTVTPVEPATRKKAVPRGPSGTMSPEALKVPTTAPAAGLTICPLSS
jgi:hypothetical protein